MSQNCWLCCLALIKTLSEFRRRDIADGSVSAADRRQAMLFLDTVKPFATATREAQTHVAQQFVQAHLVVTIVISD